MKIIRIIGRKEEADAFNRELLDKNKVIILHFFMKGCIHCENLEPKMKKLETYMVSQPRFNHVTMGKIDSEMMNDVNVENAYQFPTLKVMKDGKTHEYTASPDEASILSWLDKILSEKKERNMNTNTNAKRTIGVHLSNHNSLGKKSLKNTTNNSVAIGTKLNKKTKKTRKTKNKKKTRKSKNIKKTKNRKKTKKTKN